MHHELHTEIDIDATPEVVWHVLTDLDGYVDWNPFITSSAGPAEVGQKLVNRMEPPGGMAITFKPQVTVVDDGTTFEWFGKVGFSGLFDGRHRFDLEATETGTKLTQSESLDGILVRVMRKSVDTNTLAGFEAMNAALKAKAEAVAA